jgi:hypothetical protein
MKLTLFNGSPRGKKSNTKILMDHFTRGFQENHPENSVEILYLTHARDREKASDSFSNSEVLIIALPLYVDCMPAMVKETIESLEPLCNNENNPALGFVIQSGFPESIHSTFLKQYFIKLCKRLNCQYLGTVIKGGVEGIQIQPPWMKKKLFQSFFQLGKSFIENSQFDEAILHTLSKPKHLSKRALFFFKFFSKLGLTNFYWNSQMKKNNAYNDCFRAPFKRDSSL